MFKNLVFSLLQTRKKRLNDPDFTHIDSLLMKILSFIRPKDEAEWDLAFFDAISQCLRTNDPVFKVWLVKYLSEEYWPKLQDRFVMKGQKELACLCHSRILNNEACLILINKVVLDMLHDPTGTKQAVYASVLFALPRDFSLANSIINIISTRLPAPTAEMWNSELRQEVARVVLTVFTFGDFYSDSREGVIDADQIPTLSKQVLSPRFCSPKTVEQAMYYVQELMESPAVRDDMIASLLKMVCLPSQPIASLTILD